MAVLGLHSGWKRFKRSLDGSDPVKGCENVRSARNDPSRLPCLAINRPNGFETNVDPPMDPRHGRFDRTRICAREFPVISVSLAVPNDPSFENHYESRLSRYRYRTIKDPYRTFTRNDKILNHFSKVRRSPSPTYFHPRPV